MTAVDVRTKDKVTTGGTRSWSDMFPTGQVNPQQSLMFMKKLLAVSLSNITYLRAMFPEYAYGDRGLDDLNLKILKDDTYSPGAKEVIRWIKGCFDAIDRNYLRQVTLGVFSKPEDEETLIESYSFKFSYNHDAAMTVYRNKEKIAESRSLAETKKATMSLLRTVLVLVQTLKPLPENALLTMKLYYYDEVTPPDYEPPGFQPAASDKFSYETETVNIKAGDVSTPFHTMKVRIRCDHGNFQSVGDRTPPAKTKENEKLGRQSEEVEEAEQKRAHSDQEEAQESSWAPEEESMVTHADLEPHSLDSKDDEVTQPMLCDESVIPPTIPHEPAIGKSKLSKSKGNKNEKKEDQTKSETKTVHADADDFGVKCPCGFNEDDGLMILCAGCKHWQHAICFKIIDERDAPESHICNKCVYNPDNSLPATDPHLSGLNDLAAQATCIWRRTLLACLEMTKIRLPLLMRRLGMDNAVAEGLLNRLQKEGYVKTSSKGKRYGKEVDHGRIRKFGIPKYFGKDKSVGSNAEERSRQSSNLGTKSRNKRKEEDEEVIALSVQTEALAVDAKNNTEKEELVEEEDFRKVPGPGTKSRGRKRAKSRLDDSQLFDISSSQDTGGKGSNKAKRAKTSQTAKSVPI